MNKAILILMLLAAAAPSKAFEPVWPTAEEFLRSRLREVELRVDAEKARQAEMELAAGHRISRGCPAVNSEEQATLRGDRGRYLDGKVFTRKIKGFIHEVRIENGTLTDNAAAFFGEPPVTTEFFLDGLRILVGGRLVYTLSENGAFLTGGSGARLIVRGCDSPVIGD